MIESSPVIISINETSAGLARKVRSHLPGAEIHGLFGRVSDADVHFQETIKHLKTLFSDGRPIIAILSTGIIIRALAPLLNDKFSEPPVLILSEDGKSIIPLLGGHRGANEIGRRLNSILGGNLSITTAGDLRFGVSLDAPPKGWKIIGRENIKVIMADLLNGGSVNLCDETSNDLDKNWLFGAGIKFSKKARHELMISYKAQTEGLKKTIFCPSVLSLGIGCERGVDSSELFTFINDIFFEYNLNKKSIACISTIEIKEDEVAISELSAALEVPLRLFTAKELDSKTSQVSDPSKYVFSVVGSHSVSEASALSAAGSDGELIVPKQVRSGMTCAVAIAKKIIDPSAIGRARGCLSVIGIGPGSAIWRSPEATNEIAKASDLVGYSLYLDLLGSLADDKSQHRFLLGQENDRVVKALDLASEGKNVALISSGDAGIYAMASLVFENLDRSMTEVGGEAWQRLEVRVVPGISAFQAIAARVGAPFGHDFCTISLSNLLTPWDAIERRLVAAAEGDFVIALYNPVSAKRKEQLGIAKDIILKYRDPETPVALGKNLGRNNEKISFLTLSELDVKLIDMLTIVVIGSSQSKLLQYNNQSKHMYTPRGYSNKKDLI